MPTPQIPGLPPAPPPPPIPGQVPQLPPGSNPTPQNPLPPPPQDAAPPADPAPPTEQPPSGGGATGQIFTPGIGWHTPGQGGNGWGSWGPNYSDGQMYGGVSPTSVGQVRPEDLAGFEEFEDASYEAALRRLDPQWQAQERAFRQRMLSAGHTEGGEAWDNAWANFSRDRNDAYQGARRGSLADALTAQGQAFQQQFGQSQLANNLATAGIGAQASMYGSDNATRASMYGHDMGRANFTDQLNFNQGEADFRNLMSLLGYGGSTNSSNNQLLGYDQGRAGVFNGMIPGVQPGQIDVTGPYAAYQQGLQNNANSQNQADAQAQQQQMQAAMLAASFFLSSRSAKTSDGPLEPHVALAALAALPVDRWKYLGSDVVHVGPYAEDFNHSVTGQPKTTISVIDMLGTLVSAVKGLHDMVSQQSERIDALEVAHAAG